MLRTILILFFGLVMGLSLVSMQPSMAATEACDHVAVEIADHFTSDCDRQAHHERTPCGMAGQCAANFCGTAIGTTGVAAAELQRIAVAFSVEPARRLLEHRICPPLEPPRLSA